MNIRLTHPVALNEQLAKQDVALRAIGFKFHSDYMCPRSEIDGHRHPSLVYERDGDCFCLKCRIAFRLPRKIDTPGAWELIDPRVVEEIGQAIFPEQPGFKIDPGQHIVQAGI